MKYILFAICILVSMLMFMNCNSPSGKKAQLNEEDVLKIYVDEKGKITANGKIVILQELDNIILEYKDKKGTVYFSRASPMEEPPKESLIVIEMVMKQGLPFRFYTDNSFNTVFEPNQ